jgi:6-phosphogluconolactonase
MHRRMLMRALGLAAGSLTFLTVVVGTGWAGPLTTRGAVYVETNTTRGNTVAVFARDAGGTLRAVAAFATGGNGSGAGLGSQGAVILSADERHLLAVNAGSGTISSFLVSDDGVGLTLADVESSRGASPISLTMHGDLVYVLNSMGTGNIAGFRLAPNGTLTLLNGSQRALSDDLVDPAQVAFDPDGTALMVTEKATNLIATWTVEHGRPRHMRTTPSSGATPFGFAFDPSGHAIVSEAFGGAEGASAVSSYAVGGNGAVEVVSPSVPDGQTAACWVAVTSDGTYAYTSNTGSDNVSSYTVGVGGELSLLEAVAADTGAGSAPSDMDLDRGADHLYVLDAGSGKIGGFTVGADGRLTKATTAGVLPDSVSGLAAS